MTTHRTLSHSNKVLPSRSLVTCIHTGVALATSNHFHNVRILRLVAEHPIFNAKASELEDLLSRPQMFKLTATEYYLTLSAYLVNAGLVDTTKHPLLLLNATKSELCNVGNVLNRVIPLLRKHHNNPIIRKHKNDIDTLPIYTISPDNCDNLSGLVMYLKTLLDKLAFYYGEAGALSTTNSTYKDDADLELEKELTRIEGGYNDLLPTNTIKIKYLRWVQPIINTEEYATLRALLLTTKIEKYRISEIERVTEWVCHNGQYDMSVPHAYLIKQQVVRYFEALLKNLKSDNTFEILDLEPIERKTVKVTSNSSVGGALAKLKNLSAKPKVIKM